MSAGGDPALDDRGGIKWFVNAHYIKIILQTVNIIACSRANMAAYHYVQDFPDIFNHVMDI